MKTLTRYTDKRSSKKELVNIFLVEDDMMYLLAFGYNLQKIPGYKVSFYSSGEECLRNLDLNPNIVVLDYYLDGGKQDCLNGLELLNKIKKRKPETVVVMLSAQKEMYVALRALEEGAYTYLIKDKQSLKQLELIINEIIIKAGPLNNNRADTQ